MSEKTHLELSALVDGELPRAQAHRMLDAVIGDESLRERWRRYHLVSDALAGRRSEVAGADRLGERIRADLTHEPVLFTPRTRQAFRLGPIAGAALAASVALAAVLTTGSLLEHRPGADVASVTQASPPTRSAAPVSGGAAPARPARGLAVANAGQPRLDATLARMSWNDSRPAVEARLNGYLLNHNEYLAGGVRGMLPYARVVGYDARN